MSPIRQLHACFAMGAFIIFLVLEFTIRGGTWAS